jgi:putative FmdB family regulatory protein
LYDFCGKFVMPIYAYRCEACGFAKDALQKISDAPLTECPACGKSTFKKQVTAAGFQLKGTGWYVTDFRGGQGGTSAPASGAGNTGSTSTAGSATTGAGGAAGSSSAATATSTGSAATDGKPKTTS